MTDACDIARDLEHAFQVIQDERMADVPILNAALCVKAVGFQEWNEFWFGVLITPWFMNLMLLPRGDCENSWAEAGVGSKHIQSFPAGRYEFIVGDEPSIGCFLMCSLFSPVFEFGDQETAELTAEEVVKELFKAPDPAEVDERDEEMQMIWEGELPSSDDVARDSENSGPEDAQLKDDEALEQAENIPREMSRRELLRGLRRDGEREVS